MKRLAWILLPLALCFSIPALAVDFSQPILGADGKPIMAGGGKDAQTTTLGSICASALFASYPDEQNLSGEDKVKRAALAMKLYNGGEVSLSAEETALVKRLVAKAYAPLVVYRSWSMLDPTTEGVTAKTK